MRVTKRCAILTQTAACILALGFNAAAKVTVVTYWDKWGGQEGEYIKAVVDKFNKTQNRISVKYSFVQADSIHEKFLTTTIAGAGPDIVGLWNHRIAYFVQQGLVRPLDAYLPSIGIDKKNLLPKYWDMMSMAGKVYALPITNACFGLYINRNVFAESGLSSDTSPKSFDDMVELSEKVSRRDAQGRYTRVGFALNDPGWWPYIWPVAFGGSLYNEKSDVVDLDQPAMSKSYDFVSMCGKRWGANILTILKAGGSQTKTSAFYTGKTSMEINGSWVPSNISKIAPQVKYSIHPLPYGGERTQVWSWLESDMVFLGKTKHTKEAVEFLRYLMGPEGQKELNLRRETYSAVRTVNTSDFMRANGNPAIESLVKLAGSDQASFAPKTIIWNDITAAFSTVFNDTWNQKKSAAQAIAGIRGPITSALKKVQRRQR